MAKGDDKIAKELAARLSAANAMANTMAKGAGFFSNDPHAQYPVYMGGVYGGKPSGVMGGVSGGSSFMPGVSAKPQGTDYGEAVLAPTRWDSNRLREFVNQGIINKIPGFEPGMGMPQIQSAWESMVQASIKFNQGLKPGDNPWTPWDVMNSWSDNKKGAFGTKREGDWVYDVATGERIKYVGPKTKTTTQKNIDLSSPEDVKAIATQALRELLGRAPTGKELAQFKASINAEERANPTVVTTTQTLSPDLASGTVDVVSSESTTSGGVSEAARAALIQDPTVETKEYGKYQSATTYWDAMMQMLAGG